MARINSYPLDNNVTGADKWIGTDSDGLATKNFTPSNVAKWINSVNAVGIAGQSNFKFQTDLTNGRNDGTISFDAVGGDLTNISSISTFKISKYATNSKLILDYLNNLIGEYILFCRVDDINKFGVFTLNSITQDVDEPDFYDVAVSLETANGVLEVNKYYGIVIYPGSSGGSDTHYAFTQVAAAQTWNITHNLDKFPSVSVVDSANNIVIGDVLYNNENELTVTFTSAFSGKAYLN